MQYRSVVEGGPTVLIISVAPNPWKGGYLDITITMFIVAIIIVIMIMIIIKIPIMMIMMTGMY